MQRRRFYERLPPPIDYIFLLVYRSSFDFFSDGGAWKWKGTLKMEDFWRDFFDFFLAKRKRELIGMYCLLELNLRQRYSIYNKRFIEEEQESW